ncbi:MAG: cation:proton antiporter [Myxococcales bacterium]|nr:cation:proton antiporter [Myxococcales bacterium]
MDHSGPALVFALALGVGVLCQIVARHLRLPSIVLLLFAGVAIGPDGLHWIDPSALGSGLLEIVRLAVAIILFEGGLNLELSRLRRASGPIRTLATTGALLTAIGGAIAAHFLMDWSWSIAALFGTLVAVTGPTVVKPLLRLVPLRPRLATVLEAEGVLIDPVGAILAAVTLEVVLEASVESIGLGLGSFVLRMGFGAAMGLGGGWLLARILRAERLVPEGFENLVTLGSALLLYVGCDLVIPESGILAVTLAGVMVGNLGVKVGSELGAFEETITIGLIGVLFVLLAADVRVAEVIRLGTGGLLTVAALMFLVRPINVAFSTRGSDLDWRDRAFLSWVAPRGVVAAAVASLFAGVLEAEGVEGAREMRALVFLTIAITVVIQGGTAPGVARLLGVRAPGRENFVILGAEELGLALGDVLRGRGRTVVFVDSNPSHCRAAEEREFQVVFGDALAAATLARARLERAAAVVGLTANDELNSLFGREAREDFGVRDTYVALGRGKSAVTGRILEKQESRVLFDGPKDVERWNVRFRHEQAHAVELQFRGVPEPAEDPPSQSSKSNETDSHLLLAVCRDEEWAPYHQQFEARAGDRALAAVHSSEQERALAALFELGWEPVPDEDSGEEHTDGEALESQKD